MISSPEIKGQGDFFAVDRRVWAVVCGMGMNAAVAYLVLARGTGASNVTSTWSVHAIETYTSISRGRALEAIKALQRAGLVHMLREGTRPQYRLVPAHEVHGCEGYPPSTLDEVEQRIIDLLRAGELRLPLKASKEWSYRNPTTVAKNLVHKRWLHHLGNGRFAFTYDFDAAMQPDWIWLPNALVSGAAGETPPVELVRQTQDPKTLRLLVDLYHVQNLREDGGISRKLISQKYDRIKVGQQSQFVIWAFRHTHGSVSWTGPTAYHRREQLTPEEKAQGLNAGVDYFSRENQLKELGLLEWIPHLVEGNEADAEIIHPLGYGASDRLDDQIGCAAHRAAGLMVTEGQLEWADRENLRLVPVPRHMANVAVIGIARLRYRARTRMTAAWWAEYQASSKHHLDRYNELAAERADTDAMSA